MKNTRTRAVLLFCGLFGNCAIHTMIMLLENTSLYRWYFNGNQYKEHFFIFTNYMNEKEYYQILSISIISRNALHFAAYNCSLRTKLLHVHCNTLISSCSKGRPRNAIRSCFYIPHNLRASRSAPFLPNRLKCKIQKHVKMTLMLSSV